MSSRHIDVGGYSIQVFEQGEGPTLVFGHSLTFDSACELVDPDDNPIQIRGFGEGVVNAQ